MKLPQRAGLRLVWPAQVWLPLLIVFLAAACTKETANAIVNGTHVNTALLYYGDTVLLGKWAILNDSSWTGAGYSNHAVDYEGKTGDYFNFSTDGNVYTREGAVLDTLSYHLLADSSIVIASFGIILNGIPETSYITTLTAHKVTIVAPLVSTPGGEFGRKVNLTR
jgi:hypothetical protein